MRERTPVRARAALPTSAPEGGADPLSSGLPRLFGLQAVNQMKDMPPYYDVANGELHTAVLLRRAMERGLRFHTNAGWCSEASPSSELHDLIGGELLYDSRFKYRQVQIFDLGASVVQIDRNQLEDATPTVDVDVWCPSRQAAELEVERLRELLPAAVDGPTEMVAVSFWSRGNRGPREIVRKLEAPTWADSSANYPAHTRSALKPLMTDVRAALARGRLLLWHGEPGTGKTTALRTLARENSRSIQLEYVLDPEAFFGMESGYYVDVLFDQAVEADKTRLLVLEDCDELLSVDAKLRAGQGLARLLNLVDGLIGHGLRVAVLITTNEPLGGFHQAVTRPGRCGAAVGFDLFDNQEAAEWMAANEVIGVTPDRCSLADLFALRNNPAAPIRRKQPRIGFERQTLMPNA